MMRNPAFGNWTGAAKDLKQDRAYGRDYKIATYPKIKRIKQERKVVHNSVVQLEPSRAVMQNSRLSIVTMWEPGKDYYVFYNGGPVFGDIETINYFCVERSIPSNRIKSII